MLSLGEIKNTRGTKIRSRQAHTRSHRRNRNTYTYLIFTWQMLVASWLFGTAYGAPKDKDIWLWVDKELRSDFFQINICGL